MALLIGLIFLALGISLAVAWWPAFSALLIGLVPLSLLFWGVVLLIVGYSEKKARREYQAGVAQDEATLGRDNEVPA